jgi:hypothetical protein
MGIEQFLTTGDGDFVEMGPQMIKAVNDLAQKLCLLRDSDVGLRDGGEQRFSGLIIEPYRVIRRAGKTEQPTVLGQQLPFHPVLAGQNVESVTHEQECRPALNGTGADHAAAVGDAGVE